MYLVGLYIYIYYKMIHGPYNVKTLLICASNKQQNHYDYESESMWAERTQIRSKCGGPHGQGCPTPPNVLYTKNCLRVLWNWFPFIWQKAVFWIHVLQTRNIFAHDYRGGGESEGTDYRVAGEPVRFSKLLCRSLTLSDSRSTFRKKFKKNSWQFSHNFPFPGHIPTLHVHSIKHHYMLTNTSG